MIDNDSTLLNTQQIAEISPNVTWIDSFSNQDYISMIEANPEKILTRTALSGIPWGRFPAYKMKHDSWLGRQISKWFGSNDYKYHKFMKGRRVKGKLYDYNYLCYYESGAVVKMQRKRGGWLKRWNGYKDCRAQELVINYDDIAFELDYHMPYNDIMPQLKYMDSQILYAGPFNEPSVKLWTVNSNISTRAFGKKIKFIDAFVNNNLGYGRAKELLKPGLVLATEQAQRKWGNNSEDVVVGARITTPTKTYFYLPNADIHSYNHESLRKVFEHGFYFFITVSTNDLGGSFLDSVCKVGKHAVTTALKNALQQRNSLKIAKIQSGKVRLAGKFDDQWGGMTIEK